MATLVLVRHARSAPDPQRPASEWGLSGEGVDQAAGLAERLAALGPTVVAAGPEPRMAATVAPVARSLGLSVEVDEAFAESRPAGWVAEDRFERTVAAFLDDPDHPPAPGWEPAASVVRRFVGGVERLVDSAAGPVVVCSGGRAITAVLCHLGVVPCERSFEAWSELGSPEVVALDREAFGDAVRWVRART